MEQPQSPQPAVVGRPWNYGKSSRAAPDRRGWSPPEASSGRPRSRWGAALRVGSMSVKGSSSAIGTNTRLPTSDTPGSASPDPTSR